MTSTIKKLNFKSVQVTDIDGTVKELDFSKEIGNLIGYITAYTI